MIPHHKPRTVEEAEELLRQMDAVASKRDCAGCGVCCILPACEATNKPVRARCRLLTEAGRCSCYAERSAECSGYRCWWAEGFFDEGHRPDRFGLLVEARPSNGGPAVFVREVWPGAADPTRTVRQFEAWLLQVAPFLVVEKAKGGFEVLGDEEEVRAYVQRMMLGYAEFLKQEEKEPCHTQTV